MAAGFDDEWAGLFWLDRDGQGMAVHLIGGVLRSSLDDDRGKAAGIVGTAGLACIGSRRRLGDRDQRGSQPGSHPV